MNKNENALVVVDESASNTSTDYSLFAVPEASDDDAYYATCVPDEAEVGCILDMPALLGSEAYVQQMAEAVAAQFNEPTVVYSAADAIRERAEKEIAGRVIEDCET